MHAFRIFSAIDLDICAGRDGRNTATGGIERMEDFVRGAWGDMSRRQPEYSQQRAAGHAPAVSTHVSSSCFLTCKKTFNPIRKRRNRE